MHHAMSVALRPANDAGDVFWAHHAKTQLLLPVVQHRLGPLREAQNHDVSSGSAERRVLMSEARLRLLLCCTFTPFCVRCSCKHVFNRCFQVNFTMVNPDTNKQKGEQLYMLIVTMQLQPSANQQCFYSFTKTTPIASDWTAQVTLQPKCCHQWTRRRSNPETFSRS